MHRHLDRGSAGASLPRATIPRGLAPRMLLAALLGLLAFGLVGGSASADTIDTEGAQAVSEDPTAVTFRMRVNAPAGLQEATLTYRVLNPKEGDVGGGGTGSFSPGAETDVTFTLETRTAQRYIPVGSTFAYHWELTDNDGDTLRTPEEEFIFLDGRYDWQSQTEGDVTVYWYGGNDEIADAAFAATRASLAETQELLNVEVPYPVRVMVWASESDGTLARRQQSASFDAQVRTGGQRVAPDVVFVFEFDSDIVRHEVAHIVTAVAGDGPFSQIPSWLDEGTAVYMQNNPGNYAFAVDFAVETDRTQTLRSMQSAANNPGQVDIFYGQSYSTVDFLIEEFGEERFAELFRTVREGASIDSALESVYGLDQDTLYNAWREANGLDAIEFTPRTDATAPPVGEATRPPLGIPTSGAGSSGGTPSGSGDDGSDGGSSGAAATVSATPDDGAAVDGSDSGGGLSNKVFVGAGILLVGAVLGVVAFRMFRSGQPAR